MSQPRRARRRPTPRRVFTPERLELEGRTLPAGNLWVASQVVGSTSYSLMKITQQGALLSTSPVPSGPVGSDAPTARGLAVDSAGNVQLYNGTFTPILSQYSPTTNQWTGYQNMPGWSTVANISYGSVAAYGNYVFVTDMATYGDANQPRSGIVRFDVTGNTPPVRFASDLEFSKLTVGQDGLLYGLGAFYPDDVTAYDLNTLQKVRSIDLKNAADNDFRAIAVDAAGEIFVATWGGNIYKWDKTGANLLASLRPGGAFEDMALDTDGQIVAGDRDGRVYATTTALASSSLLFSTGRWNAFVAFDHYVPVAASLAPVAKAGGPYAVSEGGTVTLDATASTDPNANPQPLTYLWDLNGNGVYGETGAAATRGNEVGASPVFNAAGLNGPATRTVSLRVINNRLQSSDTTATVNVTNQAPTVTLGADANLRPGDTLTRAGSFTDPGAGETYTATVDYGDGGGAQALTLASDRTFSVSHNYATAGNFVLTVRVFDGTDTGVGTIKVSVVPVTIGTSFDSLAAPTVTYGQSPTTLGGHISAGSGLPTGSVSVTVAGVTQSAPIDSSGNFATVFDTAKLGAAGSPYTITYAYAGDGTFGATSDASKTLTVNRRDLTVKADDQTKTYGDLDPNLTASYTGFAPGEGPADLGGSLTFSTDEPVGNAPVGNYTITVGGVTSSNYRITFATGVLAVTRRGLTVTADDKTKTYGDLDPNFTASYSGFAAGDGPGSLSGTLTFTTDEPAGNAPVGAYAITPGGLSSGNYKIAFAPGKLAVTGRALTVTVQAVSKVYGDNDPNFTAQFIGLAPDDTPSVLNGTVTFSTDEPVGNAPVGTYNVTPAGVSSANYVITFKPGTLTVTPRPLTVRADDASKTYGQPDPAFTVKGTGFAPGESLANLSGTPAFTTNEGNPLTAPAGTYAVTPGGLTSANYAITFAPGVLTVNRAITSLTAKGSAPAAGGSTAFAGLLTSSSVLPTGQPVTVTVTGSGGPLASGSGAVAADGTFTVLVDTSKLAAGTYSVKYAYAGDGNFTASSATASFTVTTSAYGVNPLYDVTKAFRGNAAVIKVGVTDASGATVASANLAVRAAKLVDASGKGVVITPQGGATPGNDFKLTGNAYQYHLNTTGLAPGKYTLYVTVGNDPVLHPVSLLIG